MATVSDVLNIAQYSGNPVAGGGFDAGVVIDASPLERLSQYSYYRDRDMWQQRLKDDATAANAIAQISAFDTSSPLTAYTDDLKAQLKNIQDFTRANPDALVYSRNPEKFQELNNMVNRFAIARKSATASDAIYNARKNKIDQEVDPMKRQVMQQELDLDVNDLFVNGVDAALGQTLKSSPDLKITDYQVPSVPTTTYDVIDTLPNSNITSTITFMNPDEIRARAEAAVSGFGQTTIDESAPWFQSLSPERQQLEREKAALSGVNRAKIAKAANDFNSAIGQVKAINPNFNFDSPNSGIKIIDDNISWVNAINGQIDDLNILVSQGKIKDPTGRVISTPFAKLNLEDGLSESEIVMMQTLQSSKTPLISSVEKKTQQTNDDIERRRIGLGYAELNEKRRQFDAGGASGASGSNGVDGNALNDIEVSQDAINELQKTGAPVRRSLTGKGKQNLANISRLLGRRRGQFGEEVDVLSASDIKSDKPDKAIEYELVLENGQPKVSRIMIGGQWYDRNYFRNAQLNTDKEPLKGEKSAYRTEQKTQESRPNQKQQSTSVDTYSRSELKGAGWSDAQIDAAVKAGKISVN